jgi:hypothetical protein
MGKSCRFMLWVSAICGLALLPAIANAQTTPKKTTRARISRRTIASSEAKLPEVVKKTFDEKFPNARIFTAESEKEGGVMVWDIEFREGRTHKETDIAEDGTMLEFSEQVAQRSVPKEARASIKKAAEGGKVVRVEKVSLNYEAKDGKVNKLEKAKTQYEANLAKGDQIADVVVDDQGKVIEEPKWHAAKPKTEKSAA